MNFKPQWERDLGSPGTCLGISTNGILLAGDETGRVSAIDSNSGRVRATRSAHSMVVADLLASGESKVAVSLSYYDDRLRTFALPSLEPIGSGAKITDGMTNLAISADGAFAVVGNAGKDLRLIKVDVQSGKAIDAFDVDDVSTNELTKQWQSIRSMNLDRNAKILLLGLTRSIVVFDLEKREKVHAYAPKEIFISSVAADQDLTTYFVCHSKMEIRHAADNRVIASVAFPKPQSKTSALKCGRSVIRSDKRLVAACLNDHINAPSSVFVWRYGQDARAAVFETHKGNTRGCAISANGDAVFTVGADGFVRRWNIQAVLDAPARR